MSKIDEKQPRSGRLYLVSTGCGDFENITLRAHRLICGADVIVTMYRFAPELEKLIEGKQVIHGSLAIFGDNGMMMGDPAKGPKPPSSRPQAKPFADGRPAFRMGPMSETELETHRSQLAQSIREAVTEGKCVVILDGGDPTIFGPQACNLHLFADLEPVVVPGVSCFNAANSMLRMSVVGGGSGYGSLTLTRSPWEDDDVEEEAVFDPEKPLVLFTMRSDFSYTVAKLKDRYPPETPIAVLICAGFSEKQLRVQGTLADIESRVDPEELPFEHLIYIGNFLKNSLG